MKNILVHSAAVAGVLVFVLSSFLFVLWATTNTNRVRFDALVVTNFVMPQQRSLAIGSTEVFTNIVFSSDYTGTIQIGTNFWRVGEIGVKVTQDAIDSGQFCAMRGHAVYATRHVFPGPVEGPAHKCAVCGRLVTQQPGEWQ